MVLPCLACSCQAYLCEWFIYINPSKTTLKWEGTTSSHCGEDTFHLQMGNKSTSKKMSCLWAPRNCVVVQPLEFMCPELESCVLSCWQALKWKYCPCQKEWEKRHSPKGTVWKLVGLPSCDALSGWLLFHHHHACWSLLDRGKQKGFVVIST